MTARPRNKRTTEQSGETVKTAAGAATKARTGWSPVVSVRWLEIPQKHDYPAAASYLSLLAGPAKIRALVSALKSAPVAHYMAKDILRASGLPLLPEDDVHVAKDLAQIRAGNPLSPCLMIRGKIRNCQQAQIADGYHRVCASYYTDENTDIPVKIVKS
jgi:hypothetical protein